eukprot:CAMPEP_0197181368 /NCGR_PEP_ID=MMETSP1423-20130617/5680_1 /TAXON_ID=476441 /ORGANISM="Pseudo-nitzschia heimii, Strain UNC1101" /LENGTH=202 /DNA_ID=CAMNT_0042631605 /DNA_START=308 /DNA_END=917 /DNA_ORIENTATION=+
MTTTKKTAAVAPAAADEDPLSSVARFCDRWFAAEEEEEDEERSDGGGSAAAIAEEIAGRFFSADRPDDILVFEHGFPATAPFHGVRFRGPKGPAAYRSAVSDRLSYRDASFSEPTVDDDGDEEMVSVREERGAPRNRPVSRGTNASFSASGSTGKGRSWSGRWGPIRDASDRDGKPFGPPVAGPDRTGPENSSNDDTEEAKC